MPAFAVLEPPGHADTADGYADRFIFLHDRFRLSAFLLGPLWMAVQRLWLELLLYLAGLAGVGAALYALGVDWPFIGLIFVLIQLLLGLEASSLVRWMRVRSGWRDGGVVIADDIELAERRFFDDRVARRTAAKAGEAGSEASAAVSSPSPPPPPSLPRGPAGPAVVGLFPEPGGGR